MYRENGKVRAQNFICKISYLQDDGAFVGVLKCTSELTQQKILSRDYIYSTATTNWVLMFQVYLACLDVIKRMEALTTSGWGDSKGDSRRSSWCQRKDGGGEGEGVEGRGRKGLARRGDVDGEKGEVTIREGRKGGNGEEAGGRKDGDYPSVRIDMTSENQIDIKPTEEESKASSEKRQEASPHINAKKATSWNQGGLGDSTVHEIITVGFAKILRLKLKIITQVNELITVSVSPPASIVESPSPCENLGHQDQQIAGRIHS